MHATTANLIVLEAGALRLAITPEVGGAIASFQGRAPDGRRVDWLRPASDEGLAQRNPLLMASFPLVPFCNRIRDGRASFEGREIRFPPNHPAGNSPHPLHGIGWQREWNVEQAQAREATLTLDVEASPAWPWAFAARERYVLSETQLRVEISLTNRDTARMPCGIGHHPYFPHTPGTRLATRTAAMWEADREVLPTALEVTDEIEQLRTGVELAQLNNDNNFTGWSRSARIDWQQDAIGPARHVLMEAEAPLDYFVLYCPQQTPFFCAEPVSQCTDWLNLMDRYGHVRLGGQVLEPGERLDASFTLTPRFEPA